MATILERVKKIVAKQLSVKELEVMPNTSFVDDLGADSLDLVELILALEEEFGQESQKFEIPDEDVKKIVTVQDLVNYIRQKGIEDK